jgi:hypothetical protein
MEKKLHVFVGQLFAHHSYPEFDQKLRELRAIPHSIWAPRTVLTATELKDALRGTLDEFRWWKSLGLGEPPGRE